MKNGYATCLIVNFSNIIVNICSLNCRLRFFLAFTLVAWGVSEIVRGEKIVGKLSKNCLECVIIIKQVAVKISKMENRVGKKGQSTYSEQFFLFLGKTGKNFLGGATFLVEYGKMGVTAEGGAYL